MPEKEIEQAEYEDNVITPEEFAELEKKEAKRKLVGGEKKPEPKKEPKEEKPKSGVSSLDELVLKVEKMQGKIESLEEIRHAVDERFQRFSEEIGELRSSLLEKDKTFNKIDAGFSKMEDIVKELDPAYLRKELDKRTEGITRNQAKTESLEMQIKELSKGLKDFRDILARIKDVKNLVNMSNEINTAATKIEKERRTINKTAAKIETIFSELSKKISEFNAYKDKIDFNAETMHDLMKSLDMLEVKLEGFLKKEDMDKINDKFERLHTDYKDDIQEIKDIVNLLVSSLKKTNLKDVIEKQGIDSIGSVNDRLGQFQKRLENVEVISKDMGMIENDIQALKKGMDYVKKKVESAGKPAETVEKRPTEDQREEERKKDTDALSEMIAYVRKCMELGYTTKQIKKELLGKGWPRRTVNEVILREAIRKRKEYLMGGEKKQQGKDMKDMLTSLRP